MLQTHNKIPNCLAETEQVQSSYVIYKMQKELQVNRGGCNNCGHPSQNHSCTFITLNYKYLENLSAGLPVLLETKHLPIRDSCFNHTGVCNKYLVNGIK